MFYGLSPTSLYNDKQKVIICAGIFLLKLKRKPICLLVSKLGIRPLEDYDEKEG